MYCIDIHAWISVHGYLCIWIHAWISMHGYPWIWIHAWISMHGHPYIDISKHGYPCMDIHMWITVHVYPWMDTHAWIYAWISMHGPSMHGQPCMAGYPCIGIYAWISMHEYQFGPIITSQLYGFMHSHTVTLRRVPVIYGSRWIAFSKSMKWMAPSEQQARSV